MLYRHVFDKISTEFRGSFRVFVNFAGFRGFTWISWLRDRAKYQKLCLSFATNFVWRKCINVCWRKIYLLVQIINFTVVDTVLKNLSFYLHVFMGDWLNLSSYHFVYEIWKLHCIIHFHCVIIQFCLPHNIMSVYMYCFSSIRILAHLPCNYVIFHTNTE